MKNSKVSTKTKVIWAFAFVIFGLGAIFAICDLNHTVSEISSLSISKTPEAILASSNVTDGGNVTLPIAYYDQKSDECVDLYNADLSSALYSRQFEWSSCGYYNKALEPGIVDYYLSEDYLPVAKGGELTSNRGLTDLTRWFSNVAGKSQSYTGNISISYVGTEFSYENDNFYPLDDITFSAGDRVNTDGHNHLFTMSFAVPFTLLKSGEESFEITADDDTFVYVGNELAIDMGGIHDAETGKLLISESGEVYTAIGDQEFAYSGADVSSNSSIIRIFHADRDSSDSVFKIKFKNMSLNIIESQLAGADNVQIAYDPTDPTYVGPLGKTTVTKPDTTREYIVIATIEVVMLVVFAIFATFFARSIIKHREN
ncbi:hypothetical protein IKF67_02520 [Candidatus Saccharibacteria bacterium]|nr:hypothetical protein [Candidatus Saccharibacteria bacterium]